VLKRLRAEVDPLPRVALFRAPGRGRFLGEVYDTSVSLRLRAGTVGKNDFGPQLTATLESREGGSVLRGTVGPNPYLKAFRWVWALVGSMLIVLGIVLALTLQESPGRYVMLIVGAVLLILGIGINYLLALPHLSERPKLLAEVGRVIEAESPEQ
jgi:hypothetical protein